MPAAVTRKGRGVMSVDTTELKAKVRYILSKPIGDGRVKYIIPTGMDDELMELFATNQAHLIKAINHHFALPEADLIKAINDYKEGRNA